MGAHPEATVHELVARLYDAAFEPMLWIPTLEEIARLVGADALGLSFVAYDGWAGHPPLAVGLDTASIETYVRFHQTDAAWSHALRSQPVGDVRPVMTPAELKRTLVYQEWLRPNGLCHLQHTLLWRDPPRRAGLLVARGLRPFHAKTTSWLQALVPHLQRAIEIRRRLGAAHAMNAITLDVLDGLPVGVILVDRHARVVVINAYAQRLLADRRPLTVQNCTLRTTDPKSTATLHRMIRAAVSDDGPPRSGSGLTLSRPAQRPLQILVAPLTGSAPNAPRVSAAAALFISDPGRAVRLNREWVADTFGLTAAQATLAVCLAEGRTLEEIARDLQLSITTIRDRIKQVFGRTGTRRQAELVQLLLRGPSAFRNASEGSG